MPNDDILTDDYVANLLAKDAKESSIRYSARGLEAYATPSKPPLNKPKPNTRFLRNIIRDTDSHNRELLAKEAAEARARLESLSNSGRQRRLAPGDIRKRQLGDIAAILGGGPAKRRRVEEAGRERGNGNTSNGRETGTLDADRRKRRRGGDDDRSSGRRNDEDGSSEKRRGDRKRESSRLNDSSADDAPQRSKIRESRVKDNEDLTDEEEERSRRKEHRRQRRNVSEERDRKANRKSRHRSRSRSPREHRHKESRHRDRSPRRKRKRSISSNSEDDKRPTRQPQKSERDSRGRSSPTEPNKSYDSDPLDEIIGPRPLSEPQAVRVRGRGAVSLGSGLDSRFAADYDPTADVQLDPEEDDDWGQALEALKDRQKWQAKQSDRLREAGFSEQEIKKWETGGEKREEDVTWTRKGEKREWDRGKVVDEDGTVGFEPEFGRLKDN
ncbi:hypothetical protein ACMFMG_001738 [Clarireedia jacksonii]